MTLPPVYRPGDRRVVWLIRFALRQIEHEPFRMWCRPAQGIRSRRLGQEITRLFGGHIPGHDLVHHIEGKKIRGFHVAARDHFALRPFDDEATVELCQLTDFLERNLIIDHALENV